MGSEFDSTEHPRASRGGRVMTVERIVSGGQTGADRAALDVALELDITTGGWVPRGRRAEDGVIPDRYAGLEETASDAYAPRTELNVRDSDATLVFAFGQPTGGTALTARLAEAHGKPLLVVDLAAGARDDLVAEIRAWLEDLQPRVLNVAGPRLSGEPRIHAAVADILRTALRDPSRESPLTVRPEEPTDQRGIRAVHVASFPTDLEARLVEALRGSGRLVVSIVAVEHEQIVGHVAFSPVTLRGASGGVGLAPLAVLPEFRRRGIGARLVREGLRACRRAGFGFVVVLGEPAYYRRFGFAAASDWKLADEYSGGDASQALELLPGSIPAAGGLVRYAPEFAS